MTTYDKIMTGLLGSFFGYAAYGFVKHYVLGRGTSGIGTVARRKRRIFAEVSEAQRYMDLTTPYNQLVDDEKRILTDMAKRYGFKGSKSSSKSLDEQYWNSLRRAYNSVTGVGSTNLPHTTYRIKNGRGDVVVEYSDYGTESDIFRDAMQEYAEDHYRDAFAHTVWFIANGGKLAWTKKKPLYGVKEQIFATLSDAKEEKKMRKSYLSKDGYTPDQLAHWIWEAWNQQGDTTEILNDVCDALLSVTSKEQAQKIVSDYYLNKYSKEDEEESRRKWEEENLPF